MHTVTETWCVLVRRLKRTPIASSDGYDNKSDANVQICGWLRIIPDSELHNPLQFADWQIRSAFVIRTQGTITNLLRIFRFANGYETEFNYSMQFVAIHLGKFVVHSISAPPKIFLYTHIKILHLKPSTQISTL